MRPSLPSQLCIATSETDKFSCLVMGVGGATCMLSKYFKEQAVKFYVAEVLLAMESPAHGWECDLKPENVIVREDGHITLSDFDLSLGCAVTLIPGHL